jgi:hypothetical protein
MPRPSLVTSSGPSPVRGFIAAILHPLPHAPAWPLRNRACWFRCAAEPVSHNRVDPSPYYPVFGRRMVMIGYARRPERVWLPPIASGHTSSPIPSDTVTDRKWCLAASHLPLRPHEPIVYRQKGPYIPSVDTWTLPRDTGRNHPGGTRPRSGRRAVQAGGGADRAADGRRAPASAGSGGRCLPDTTKRPRCRQAPGSRRASGAAGARTRVLQYLSRASPSASCCAFLSPGDHAGKSPTGSVTV